MKADFPPRIAKLVQNPSEACAAVSQRRLTNNNGYGRGYGYGAAIALGVFAVVLVFVVVNFRLARTGDDS